MTRYKLGTGRYEGISIPLILIRGRVHTLTEILGAQAPASLEELFADWARYDALLPVCAGAATSPGSAPEAITFGPPLSNPRKVICIGTNYHDHLQEMKNVAQPAYPYAFLRPPTALAAHGQPIRLPAEAKLIDWEAELGIVIGRFFGPADGGDPLAAVAGYTVINDVSARDWIATRPLVGIDWVMQKAWNGFQPTGPWITPARDIADAQNLAIQLTLNGEVKQASNTAQMIFTVADIITHLSRIMTLEPGDVIATGTPAGVGYGRDPQEFIKPGDRVRVTIEGLGALENEFI